MVALPLGDLYSTRDVQDSLQAKAPGTDLETVLFDTVHGGTGATEYVYEHIQTVAQQALQLLTECECGDVGCPRCLTHTSCLDDNEALSKRLSVKLLTAYLETEQVNSEADELATESTVVRPGTEQRNDLDPCLETV